MRPAAITLNYSIKNILNDVRQKRIIICIYIHEKLQWNTLVWGERDKFRFYFIHVWYLQALSKAELSHIVNCVGQLNEQEHTLLIRGQIKLGEIDTYAQLTQEACGGIAAPFVTCTTRNEWREGNVVHSTRLT